VKLRSFTAADTRIELAPEILDDFDRILEHLARFEVADAQARVAEIIEAVQVLTHSPLIGRAVRGGKRELVIGRGSHGYVALYRFVASIDTVFVLAIHSQREQDYRR
jgi:plasmid stabilization system protein ParE